MEDKLNILDKEILELINLKMAKPDKTIKQHTLDLLENLYKLKQLGYINDNNIYELVEKACIYHDIGKINDEFQNRVTGKSKKYKQDKEVVHNILSLYFININNFSHCFNKKIRKDHYI